MEKNLDLKFGMKGQLSLNAQVVPLQEGYLKLGGIADPNANEPLKFGRVVSASSDTPSIFELGKKEGNVFRGVLVFDDSIAQNAPAHPDSYLQNLPCAALNHGFFYLESWKKDSTPTLSSKVEFDKTTGEIGFTESTASSGCEILENAQIRDFDDENGVLIYLA